MGSRLTTGLLREAQLDVLAAPGWVGLAAVRPPQVL